MEEHLSPLAVTHLLQHALRSFCIHQNSQWLYAVFWRILPRNYPPPKWEDEEAYDRSKGNRRNWTILILVWEDGFCNFATPSALEINSGHCPTSSVYGNYECQPYQGLQPELFFKMSHEIYNYGEGLIGKVAADQSHKWIYSESNGQEINFLSSWQNSADAYPRPWEAQFQSGIKTIALIAVREGVIQLGGVHKVIEDQSYVVLVRKRFSYIESIPGVLLPHPSSSAYQHCRVEVEGCAPEQWNFQFQGSVAAINQLYDQWAHHSISSLEVLLFNLPSVGPPPLPPPTHSHLLPYQMDLDFMGLQNEVTNKELYDVGESSNPLPRYQDHNVTSTGPNNGF
ncbi:Protein RICE SALT SENSITIVE 3 [Mucuna pruriens]|uniref:Protein RICE SALT SENSITIVE 3 n=1 Tax=Mucuna pruriens TaxID=157652 RepID=A0A371GUH0_MUCPR|nr:Protein RICE SALT SENSITIVE 3 [Mucuna pruriens]